MTRKEVADKFIVAFSDSKHTVHVQESGYGETCTLAVSNADTNKRHSLVVDGLKTVGGKMGWQPPHRYDDDICPNCGDQGEWYWGMGPSYKHEQIGLIHTPKLIDGAIEEMRRIVDKCSTD
ncbi:hypothetical protein LCGC14_1020830 [marine sediment metagenome]|uniref:Uncharacterized protein n=1 Tax=marine sediment metagenome TaxID=412755 RepID=A0A0F9MXK1_9ZZZZ